MAQLSEMLRRNVSLLKTLGGRRKDDQVSDQLQDAERIIAQVRMKKNKAST